MKKAVLVRASGCFILASKMSSIVLFLGKAKAEMAITLLGDAAFEFEPLTSQNTKKPALVRVK
jgi:hypothetical protein